jgi:hypothetical protein
LGSRSLHCPSEKYNLQYDVTTISAFFITLEPPSADMETEAVAAGFYESPGWQRKYRRIQILTIEALLHGSQVNMPPTAQTFKQAPKAEPAQPGQMPLDV